MIKFISFDRSINVRKFIVQLFMRLDKSYYFMKHSTNICCYNYRIQYKINISCQCIGNSYREILDLLAHCNYLCVYLCSGKLT